MTEASDLFAAVSFARVRLPPPGYAAASSSLSTKSVTGAWVSSAYSASRRRWTSRRRPGSGAINAGGRRCGKGYSRRSGTVAQISGEGCELA